MKRLLTHVSSIAAFALVVPATAYEIDTHARITVSAYEQSTIATNAAQKLRDLGLLKSRQIARDGSNQINYSLGINYYDLSSAYPALRTAKTYDQLNTAVLRRGAPTPIVRWGYTPFEGQGVPYFPGDWMARGAVREDDTKELLALVARYRDGERNALDVLDVNPQLNRVCNHFYDPVNNKALDLGSSPFTLFACSASEVFGSGVQWAMGTTSLDGSGTPDSTRKNGFSILDARETMWRALTGTDKQSVGVAYTRAERDAYWATTFRSLGDVVHLLQDLSQPQHTRNEPHPGGDAGYFESHINDRALGMTEKVAGSVAPQPLPPLIYGGYVVPSFARYRDYFSTNSGMASYDGKGVANYSNRGFFTTLANFGNTKYAQPSNVLANYTPISIGAAPYVESYLSGSVPDNLSGQATTILMARESIFKDIAPGLPPQYQYSIDRRVIDAQADLVIPRAVAYSTGLINFFFRGSLNVEPTTDGVFGVLDHATDAGFKKLVVKVRNTTPAVVDSVTNGSVPQPMSAGKFVAVVRYHKDWKYQNNLSAAIGLGECDTLAAIYGAGNEPGVPGHDPTRTTVCRDGNETLVVSAPLVQTLNPDEEKEMTFDFSASRVPLGGVDYSLQVVYRGVLGYEEDAVVSGYRDLMDPMFLTRHNVYDYIANDNVDGGNEFGTSFTTTLSNPVFGPPPLNPVLFYPTNSPFVGQIDTSVPRGFPGLNWQCWSYLALDAYRCYDIGKTVKHTYTLGTRSQPVIATAQDVSPGQFTRIALLGPLNLPDRPYLPPLVRIERQRKADGPYMGETVQLAERHATKTVKWPVAMRDVNSWHSDGYAWAWSHYTLFSLPSFTGMARHCSVAPLDTVVGSQPLVTPTGTSTQTVTVTSTGSVTVGVDPAIDCVARFGIFYSDFVARPYKAYPAGYWSTEPLLLTTYSPWDVYVGTSDFWVEEAPSLTSPNEWGFRAVVSKYAKDIRLKVHGINGSLVRAQPPAASTIAAKYR